MGNESDIAMLKRYADEVHKLRLEHNRYDISIDMNDVFKPGRRGAFVDKHVVVSSPSVELLKALRGYLSSYKPGNIRHRNGSMAFELPGSLNEAALGNFLTALKKSLQETPEARESKRLRKHWRLLDEARQARGKG